MEPIPYVEIAAIAVTVIVSVMAGFWAVYTMLQAKVDRSETEAEEAKRLANEDSARIQQQASTEMLLQLARLTSAVTDLRVQMAQAVTELKRANIDLEKLATKVDELDRTVTQHGPRIVALEAKK